MSGRGQHFIPQHFQKPFVFSEDKDQLWMYRRGKNKPILTARGDAGKERDFYSTPSPNGDLTLDDLITNYEQTIFPLIDNLRILPIGSAVDSRIASEIVVHFFFRSQFLRKSVSEVWDGLISMMHKLAADPGSVIGAKRLPAHRAPVALASAIHEQISLHQLVEMTGVNSETLARIIYMSIREQLDQVAIQVQETILLAISQFDTGGRERIRDAHRDILISSLAPPKRIEQLSDLNWKIVEHANSSAILPDCVCIAAGANRRWQSLLFVDEVELIIMPLTPNKLLIGKKIAEETFDVKEFNSLAAMSCFEFFLSSEELPTEAMLKADLGQSVRTEIGEMISENVLEAITAYLSAPMSEQASDLNKIRREAKNEEQYSYQITLFDFGDKAFAEKVAEALNEIVVGAEVGVAYSLIDGFTFADGYEEAIFSLDRGYDGPNTVKSENSSFGIGVAIPLTVMREGEFKTRFILRSFLAHNLLSEEEDLRLDAIEIILYLVQGLLLDNLKRTRFSGWMLEEIQMPIEGYFHHWASKLFDIYYSTRCSTKSLNGATIGINTLRNHLPNIISECTKRRRLYRMDGELDGFLELVFEQVDLVLSNLTRILGAFAAVNGAPAVPPEIEELLRSYQMNDWLSLYAADLSNFHEKLDAWENFEEIFFLNRHFERWLLMFGVIIQDSGDGQFYAHIPLGIDEEYLTQLAAT